MKHFSFIFLIFLCFHVSYSQSDSTISIFFNFNEFHLRRLSYEKIQSEFSGKQFGIKKITGFADTAGSNYYNLKLSEKRTLSVYNFLLKNRLVDSNVTLTFYGEEKSGHQDAYLDRRVEVQYEIPEQGKIVGKDSVVNPKVFEVYNLSNIYFKPNLAVVESFSLPDLEITAKYLQSLHDCRFEIVGHVNAPLSESAMKNSKALMPIQKLSEDRARTIFDLLAEYGISKEKMSTRGAGNSQMVIKNPKNEDEMRKNMRVEILIYCNKFP